MAAETLDLSQIQEILSNTRGRGEYATYLKDFLDSGEAGIRVDLESGILAGKSVDKAYVGLNNARTAVITHKDGEGNIVGQEPKLKGADKVKVVKGGDKESPVLFLINRSLVEGVSGEDATDDGNDD